jgi:hypothetical protein
VESGVIRVCGGSRDCSRKGHKKEIEQGEPGVYNTVKTHHYVDGILSTHRTVNQEKEYDAVQKAHLLKVTSQLTGTKTYQDQLKAMEQEFESEVEEECEVAEKKEMEEWDDHINEEDLKMPSWDMKSMNKKKGSTVAGRKGAMPPSRKKEMTTDPAVADPMTDLMKEVKEALRDVATSMMDLSKAQQGKNKNSSPLNTKYGRGDESGELEEETMKPHRQERKHPDKKRRSARKGTLPWMDNEDSSEEEIPRKATKMKESKGSSKHQMYYAVARGRNPGVYTEWGQAERQVNGFSGSLHKKFKDKKSDLWRHIKTANRRSRMMSQKFQPVNRS